jgi:hypothetical protein
MNHSSKHLKALFQSTKEIGFLRRILPLVRVDPKDSNAIQALTTGQICPETSAIPIPIF